MTLAAVAKCLQAATWLVARGNKRENDEKTKKPQKIPGKNAACQPKPQRPPVPSRLSGPKESSGSVQRTPLPFPNYVVFYNGNAEEPDETMLCLSEAFLLPDQDCTPAVECRVRVLNINQGHNRELMEQCRRLWEYAEFIECIRNNLKDGLP